MKQAIAFEIERYLALTGIPRGPKSKQYLVDPVNGAVGGPGTSFLNPLAGITAAEDKCVGDQHDAVLMLSGYTADNPSAIIGWDKDYTHLVGLSGDLPGMGQRCRIVGTAGNDLTRLITISGKGSIFRNLQFFNGADADADAGAALVSGDRNYFKNVFFAGMGHATPAARAGSYSLNVSGSENFFEDCVIGLDTILRAAANSELIVSGVRNHFRRCMFLSNSVTSGKFLIKLDNSGGDLRYTIFEDCLYYNYSENWATGIANVFSMPSGGATHYVILRGNNQLVGTGLGWGDTVTHIYGAGPQPNAGFGISTNPTT